MENKLFYDKKTGWDRMSDRDQAAMMDYAEGYKAFLDEAKTERDAVARLKEMAEAKGFAAYERGMELHPGDKLPIWMHRVLISVPFRCMRTTAWHCLKPIITAASRNTSGRLSRWSCGVWYAM